MTIKNLIITACLTLSLFSCSGPGKIVGLPNISNPNNVGEITFINEKEVVEFTHVLTLNGQNIAKIKAEQYLTIKLNPGDYKLGVKFWGYCYPKWQERLLFVDVEAKSKHYYLIWAEEDYGIRIKPIGKKEAQKRMQEKTRININSSDS